MRRPPAAIVEVRRFGDAGDPRPTLVARHRRTSISSARSTAPGATWLDSPPGRTRADAARHGRVRPRGPRAMEARADHLVEEGLARRRASGSSSQRDLLNTLRRRELTPWARGRGRDRASAHEGRGRRTRRRHLSPAPDARLRPLRHDRQWARLPARALVARAREEARPACRRRRAKDGGGIEWSFGRKRGLGLLSPPKSIAQGMVGMSANQNPLGPDHRCRLIVLVAIWACNRVDRLAAWLPAAARAPLVRCRAWTDLYPPVFFWWWFVYDAYAPRIFVEGAFIAASGDLHLDRGGDRHVGLAGARGQRYAETYGSARWADAARGESGRSARSGWRRAGQARA